MHTRERRIITYLTEHDTNVPSRSAHVQNSDLLFSGEALVRGGTELGGTRLEVSITSKEEVFDGDAILNENNGVCEETESSLDDTSNAISIR